VKDFLEDQCRVAGWRGRACRIARSLGIAPETVKTHAKGILSKLEARTRAQAVARAEAIGLL
jgi:DNA-binding NarL/FixJ family response regulator